MELDAVDRQLDVPHAHDHTAASAGGDLQLGGQRLGQNRQRVIAGRGKWIRKSLQHTDIGVEYAAGLAVQQFGRAVDGAAERHADGLVTQAHAQQRSVRAAAQARTRRIEAPARSGVPGPGLSRMPSNLGRDRGGSASRASSLRQTCASTPSWPRYWTRLNTKLS